mmetsp:Transcript_31666/g.61233  ORF Transcript_31666/g.61233 Transcript_31666/m.61233 type:complete len:256 (-) Transcript_31666:674-1441(-)
MMLSALTQKLIVRNRTKYSLHTLYRMGTSLVPLSTTHTPASYHTFSWGGVMVRLLVSLFALRPSSISIDISESLVSLSIAASLKGSILVSRSLVWLYLWIMLFQRSLARFSSVPKWLGTMPGGTRSDDNNDNNDDDDDGSPSMLSFVRDSSRAERISTVLLSRMRRLRITCVEFNIVTFVNPSLVRILASLSLPLTLTRISMPPSVFNELLLFLVLSSSRSVSVRRGSAATTVRFMMPNLSWSLASTSSSGRSCT